MFTINCLQHLIFTQNGILSSISQSLYNVGIHLLYQVYKNEKVNKDTYKTSKDYLIHIKDKRETSQTCVKHQRHK